MTDVAAFIVRLQLFHLAPPLEQPPDQMASRPLLTVSVTKVPVAKLAVPVRLELWSQENSGLLKAEALVIPPGQAEAMVRVTVPPDPKLAGDHTFTIRATAMQEGKYPVVAEVSVPVEVVPR